MKISLHNCCLLFVGFLLFTAWSFNAHAQSCLTNSIIINTGYNPLTGGAVTPGVDSSTPVPDPKWIVTAEASSIHTAILARGGVFYEVTPGNNADVIAPPADHDWIWNPLGVPGSYITCFNGIWFPTDGTGPCPHGTDYNMTLGRPFQMCFSDSITFDFYISRDNYVSITTIDGTPLLFSDTCGDTGINYIDFTHFTQTVYLTCGPHIVTFELHNYNYDIPILNGNRCGLDVYGTISSATGSTSISREDSAACTTSVCALPGITGPLSVCIGSSITLSDAVLGGTWSSSNTAIGSVGSLTGVVTGVSHGIVTITYKQCGVTTTYTVKVNPLPLPIIGIDSVCVGSTTALSDPTGTGTWSSSNTHVAAVDSTTGLVTGISGGTSTITFTDAAGCNATITMTVNPLPPAIKGNPNLCLGFTTTLIDSVTGGTWASSNSAVASIGLLSGTVTGNSLDTATITYTAITGCSTSITVTVNPLPASIEGTLFVCVGSTDSLHEPAMLDGTWSSGNTTVAAIDSLSGVVTGVSSGTATISFILTTGCYTTAVMTVYPLPAPITGRDTVCVGASITLSDLSTGGTWSSGSTGIAVVGSLSGMVTGVSAGTAIISYFTTGHCFSLDVVTVLPNPAPYVIPNPTQYPICVGSSTNIHIDPGTGTDTTFSYAWTSGDLSISTIESISTATIGRIAGVSVGTAIITYSDTVAGCWAYVLDTVTVIPQPAAITGDSLICSIGGMVTLSDDSVGGTWSSIYNSIATVGSLTGVVTAVSVGTDFIYYFLPDGCSVLDTVYVDTLPSVGSIVGAIALCTGSTDTMYCSPPGGTWSSSDVSVATVGLTTGVVTSLMAGTTIISYTVADACGAVTAMKLLNVNIPMPPFITSGSIVACSAGSLVNYGDRFMLPDTTCQLVCDSTNVMYYANGVYGSVFTWTVSGGVIVENYGDSILVNWPFPGVTGIISLHDSAGLCSGFDSVCVMAIKKPDASFSASADSICLGDNIVFTDLSTEASYTTITSWNWYFGDGSYSSLENPVHSFTVPNPHDTVMLVVTNGCGCTDTFRMVI